MSRHYTTGKDPDNNSLVNIFYGYDEVPGFRAGYFFQVYTTDEETLRSDPSGEGIIVNEGFLNGISKQKLNTLAKHWQCKLKLNI